VLDSLERWQVRPEQKPPALSFLYRLRVVFKSAWRHGVLSGYRRAYWGFFGRFMLRCGPNPRKRRLGFEIALSGRHFIRYAQKVCRDLGSRKLHSAKLIVRIVQFCTLR
jgi:hypothetical protein